MKLLSGTILLCLALSISSAQRLGWLLDVLENLSPAKDDPQTSDSNNIESEPTTCPCGLTNKKGRIVGGSETSPNEYPFMLGLIYTRSKDHFCGAALLTERHAITAAHCTRGARGVPLSVVAGAHNILRRTATTQEVRVAHYVEHEKYIQNPLVVLNDIAILFLATPVKLNQYVSPICMPVSRMNLDNQIIKIIGWGKTGEFKPPSPTLLQIDVRVHTFKECKSAFGFRYETDEKNPTLSCANSPGKIACMGDSGGPAVYMDPEIQRWVLVGLVSYGDGHCSGKQPTVQTDVTGFISWINSKISGPLCHKL